MNLKYTFGAVVAFPLLPLMYIQGKKIRQRVPKLPEATGTSGVIGAEHEHHFKLITIGESTVAGVGVDTHKEGFTGTLAETLSSKLSVQIDWRVYAKSGYTAKIVKEKIIPNISEDHADLIVVGLGGNDAFTLNHPKKWRSHISELIGAIKSKFGDTPILFTNMPPIKIFPAFTPLIKWVIGNLGELLGKELDNLIAEHQNVFYSGRKITIEDWLQRFDIKASPADFFSDGVHPSKLTYQVWAKDIAEFAISERIIS